eukprot:7926783-Alexandrium_andersonii.AAC.1
MCVSKTPHAQTKCDGGWPLQLRAIVAERPMPCHASPQGEVIDAFHVVHLLSEIPSPTPIALLPDAILAIAPFAPVSNSPSTGHVGAPRIDTMGLSRRARLRVGGNPTPHCLLYTSPSPRD